MRSMARHARPLLVPMLAATLVACSNAGKLPPITNSQTSLTRANFRVLEGNVRGSDFGFSLLGFIPIVPASYGNAMSHLRAKVPAGGRSVALANVTQDASTIYLVLFSVPRVTVTADVIEFLPDSQQELDRAAAPAVQPLSGSN